MPETMTEVEELTAQQAAVALNVPLTRVHELLESGAIASRRVGEDYFTSREDVLAYKRQADQARLQALGELSALDQEHGFGY